MGSLDYSTTYKNIVLRKYLIIQHQLAYIQCEESVTPQPKGHAQYFTKHRAGREVTILREAYKVLKVHYISIWGNGKQCQWQCKSKHTHESIANKIRAIDYNENGGILNPNIQHFKRLLGGFCLVFGLYFSLVFRLPLKHQGLEAGRRLQELVDQWSDSVWQVLCSYNRGEITAYHFVCTQIQAHMHSLSQGVWNFINKKVFSKNKVLYQI